MKDYEFEKDVLHKRRVVALKCIWAGSYVFMEMQSVAQKLRTGCISSNRGEKRDTQSTVKKVHYTKNSETSLAA